MTLTIQVCHTVHHTSALVEIHLPVDTFFYIKKYDFIEVIRVNITITQFRKSHICKVTRDVI